ncbi:hypothetical protein D3C78_1306580 [compost metagenome]
MAIDTYPLDARSQQRLADALDDFGTGRVEVFHIAAKQHLARQTEGPAIVSQLETLLLEYGNLRRGQAFRRYCLATAQDHDGKQEKCREPAQGKLKG